MARTLRLVSGWKHERWGLAANQHHADGAEAMTAQQPGCRTLVAPMMTELSKAELLELMDSKMMGA